MTTQKGLSQVLSLIVAASVLMMTALLVIMFTSGSLTGFFTDNSVQSCTSTIQAQCDAGAVDADVPSSCYKQDSDTLKDGVRSSLDGSINGRTYTCPGSNSAGQGSVDTGRVEEDIESVIG